MKRITTTARGQSHQSQQRADGNDPLGEKRARKASLLAATATKLTFKHATKGFLRGLVVAQAQIATR